MKTYDIGFYAVGHELIGKKIIHNDFVEALEIDPFCGWAENDENYKDLQDSYLKRYKTSHPKISCFYYSIDKSEIDMKLTFNDFGGSIGCTIYYNEERCFKKIVEIAQRLKCNVYDGRKKVFGYNNSIKKTIKSQKKRIVPKKKSKNVIPFGYKTFWCAIKTIDTDKVLNTLNIRKKKKCNWNEGMKKAYDGGIFILPPINGWIIIHGWGLPIPSSSKENDSAVKLINSLSSKFEKAHLFGSFRGTGAVLWMSSEMGELKRMYYIDDGNGVQYGEPTKIEKQWDLIDFNHPDIENDDYFDSKDIPDEDDVLDVAEAWSINPMNIDRYENIDDFGYTGVLKRFSFMGLLSLFR